MPARVNSIQRAYRHCEQIARRNRPYLYLVSLYFRGKEKYKAFCSTYASMRVIDDQIDSIPGRGTLSSAEKLSYRKEIKGWLDKIEACQDGLSLKQPIFLALQDTFKKFPIPLFPWRNLAKAMQKDVGKDSFSSLQEFVRYAEGAAIAPATVFMFLLTAQGYGKDYYWKFSEKKIYKFARELALFCYLTHVIRDVSSDLQLGKGGLLYIAEQDLDKFGLKKKDLMKFRREKTINSGFRKLAERYIALAPSYEAKGRRLLRRLNQSIGKDSRFILS